MSGCISGEGREIQNTFYYGDDLFIVCVSYGFYVFSDTGIKRILLDVGLCIARCLELVYI